MNDMTRYSFAAAIMCGTLAAACSVAPAPEPPAPIAPEDRPAAAPIPPIPTVDGALRLDVAYPPENANIAVRDSNFIFGSTGSGRATLTINGAPIDVKPNGGWLAYLAVPADGVYRLQATKDAETATFERHVRVPAPAAAPVARARIISVTPSGALAARRGENVEVSITGTAGGRAFLVLPNGQRIPLIESRATTAAANNAADFETQTPSPSPRPSPTSRYAGILPATALRSADTSIATPLVGTIPTLLERDTLMERCAAAANVGQLERAPRCRALNAEAVATYQAGRGCTSVVLIVGNDTVRAPVALNLAVIEMSRVGVAVDRSTGGPQRAWRIRGRNTPGGPFHYFWPHGTELTITGQRGGFYRVQLAGDITAWVPASDVQLLPAGTPPAGGPITGARFAPSADYVDLRIALPDRVPYHVEETERGIQIDVFGGVSQVNFFQYGKLDPLIERAVWSQPRDSVFRVDIALTRPVWGYDAFHDARGSLVLRIRRPPAIDSSQPLRGLTILVDAGHGGRDTATVGPTRFAEAHANLAIANALEPLLAAAGAKVVMTRRTNIFLELAERTQMAVDSGAHLLVSVHNNAFPDGVNPFNNNGTSTYYYHPHSVDLAQSMQGELLAELGLRDIGYGRADLALVRPTWLPAVLTETSFMMVPEQEAGLKNPEWVARIARAHLRGLEAFLRKRAAAQ
ncbi:MAG: N-acetylmuramoyl-L-alanine amidase [Gemmatimonadota bacterium]